VSYFTNNKLVYWPQTPEYLRGLPITPVTWELDTTTVCNQNCPGCVGNRNGVFNLPPHEASKIVNDIIEAGGQGLILTGGGDPILNRDALMSVLGKMPTLLLTNGETFTPEYAREVLPHLVGVRFSLDAYSGGSASQWRGITAPRWHKTLENIEATVAIKKELGLDVTIGAAFLTDQERNAGILSFADIADALGVDFAQYRPMLWSTTAQQQPDWDYPVFSEFYDLAHSRYPDLVCCSQQKYDRMAAGTTARDYSKCNMGRFASTIGADGKMYFCCHTRYMPSFCLGDLNETPLAEILASNRIEEMREQMTFEVCPTLCRGDAINRVVTDMVDNRPDHIMFL
jgi:MoaA/NifB/PqqE/SkfB family radical SAM enzyme